VRALQLLGSLVVASVVLTGCASFGAPATQRVSTPKLTLSDSKEAAQLIRNDAATRLPDVMVKQVADLTDVSVACGDASTDASGVMRAWSSGATLLITNSQAARIDIVSTRLVQTYVDSGWTATTEPSGATTLEKEGKPVISVVSVSKDDGPQPLIRIETAGPCVATDGPDSLEVRELEKASSASP
jgi:hypothetical protein